MSRKEALTTSSEIEFSETHMGGWNMKEGYVGIKLHFSDSKVLYPLASSEKGAAGISVEPKMRPISRDSDPCSSRVWFSIWARLKSISLYVESNRAVHHVHTVQPLQQESQEGLCHERKRRPRLPFFTSLYI